MSNDNYLIESSFSSWSELNTGNSLDSNSLASLSAHNACIPQHNADYCNVNTVYQNLITYELERPNTQVGFGFDLKGDRPAIIGSVRKGTIADQCGLKEGDLVISINNKKVTDLDHDHVVRHIGLAKTKLVLQVTKIKYENILFHDNGDLKSCSNKNNYKKSSKLKSNENFKYSTKKVISNNNILKEKNPPNGQFSTRNSIFYYDNKNDLNDANSLTNNTKTTEDDEEDSDLDYDFFLMTGRRRRRHRGGHHHHHHHHHNHHNVNGTTANNYYRHSKRCTSRGLSKNNVILKSKSSKMKLLKNNNNNINNNVLSVEEFVNDENVNFEVGNNEDYEDDIETEETEDTEDTEDTEENVIDYKKKYLYKANMATQANFATMGSSQTYKSRNINIHNKKYYSHHHHNQISVKKLLNKYSQDSSILSGNSQNASHKKRINSISKANKIKMYQSPKSRSSSRFSNSELNDNEFSLNSKELSTYESEKEIIMMKHQPKKSKIIQTNTKSKLNSNYQYSYDVDEKTESLKRNAFVNINNLNSKNSKASILQVNKLAKYENSEYMIINYAQIEKNNNSNNIEEVFMPVNIKKNCYINEKGKLANIKHFTSSTNLKTNWSPKNFNNNAISSDYSNLSLNVYDLFAILEPIIKPHIYQAQSEKQLQNQTYSFKVIYFGSISIPYDTLSNASKLASIRDSIECQSIGKVEHNQVLIKDANSIKSASLVCLNVAHDYVKIIFTPNSDKNFKSDSLDVKCKSENALESDIHISKSEIAFCGRIKNSDEYFAIVILSSSNNDNQELLNSSLTNDSLKLIKRPASSLSSCLIFQNKLNLKLKNPDETIEIVLNEISKIYRNNRTVFNTNSIETMNNSLFEFKNCSPNVGAVPYQANLNYEFLSYADADTFEKNDSFSSLKIIKPQQITDTKKKVMKTSNSKEIVTGSSKSATKQRKSTTFKTDSLKSIKNNDIIERKTHINVPATTANTATTTSNNNGMKMIKENLTNFFKKNHAGNNHKGSKNIDKKSSIGPVLKNDMNELLKTIEIETNKNQLIKNSKNDESPAKQQNKPNDTSLSSNSNTIINKFSFNSLNNRLSMKFASSSTTSTDSMTSSTTAASLTNANSNTKPKKVSNQFPFLKSKPPIHAFKSATLTSPRVTSRKDKSEHQFFDAAEVLDSLENAECNNLGIKKSSSSSRLSYPLGLNGNNNPSSANKEAANNNNQKLPVNKTNAKKNLFSFITGNYSQDDNISNKNKLMAKLNGKNLNNLNNFNNNNNRRLSDFYQHQQIKSLNLVDDKNLKLNLMNSTNEINQDPNLNLKTDDQKNLSGNDVGRVARWALSFEKLLEDTLGLQVFTEFLKKEFSEENIDFWVICENYKKITDLEEQKKEAQNIWNLYLDTSSLHQINVDNKARSQCKEGIEGDINVNIFDIAQTQIYNLMKYDSYTRFLKSQMYKDCIINEIETKPIILTSNSNQHHINTSQSLANVKKANHKANDSSPTIITNNDNSSSISNIQNELNSKSSDTVSVNNINYSTNNSTQNAVATFQNPGDYRNNFTGSLDPLSCVTATATSTSSSANINKENKDKKKTTIMLPWTKGGSKKHNDEHLPQSPTPVSGTAATLGRGISLKTSFLLSSSINDLNNQFNDSINSTTQSFADHMFLNTSGINNTPVDTKFCRVYFNNDESSTMIQVGASNVTVYQMLSKILQKKNLPWYKIDIYYITDNKPVDPHMEAHLLGSKEIVIAERSLFILSLIPIAINLCVKANKKKNIIKVLQPILDHYQIKTNNCIIYLNSAKYTLNLYDCCSTIDHQHLLVVHKHQSNMLSAIEIDKYVNISVKDFIPTTSFDMSIQFDELGIMKQLSPNVRISMGATSSLSTSLNTTNNIANNSSNTSNNENMFAQNFINKNLNQHLYDELEERYTKKILKNSHSIDQDDRKFIDLLNRAQNYSINDQRGKIDNTNLDIPNFLLSDHQPNINLSLSQYHLQNTSCNNTKNQSSISYYNSKNGIHQTVQSPFMSNNSTNFLLPKQVSASLTSLPILDLSASATTLPYSTSFMSKTNNKHTLNSMSTSRSRSPVVIVYDYEDLDLNAINSDNDEDKNNSTENFQEKQQKQLSKNEEAFKSKLNFKNQSIKKSASTLNNSQISYV